MKRLGIIGSGDLGQLIAYHAVTDQQYEVAGFFDDFREPGSVVDGYPVLGGIKDVASSFDAGTFDCLMIAIGYKHFEQRKYWFEYFLDKIPYGKLVHSSCYVDPSGSIGNGTFILPGCIIDRNVIVEDNVLINTGSCIAHDSTVKAHSFLSPRVAIAGFVTIGECCNIGINSTIIDNITIANGVQTGGGTVVIKNLQDSGLYVGNPAKFIR